MRHILMLLLFVRNLMNFLCCHLIENIYILQLLIIFLLFFYHFQGHRLFFLLINFGFLMKLFFYIYLMLIILHVNFLLKNLYLFEQKYLNVLILVFFYMFFDELILYFYLILFLRFFYSTKQ